MHNNIHFLLGHHSSNLPHNVIQVFQQDPGITNDKTTLNGIFYKILFQYETAHTDLFLNGFVFPLVVQRD